MNCPKCGYALVPNAAFCQKCGSQVGAVDPRFANSYPAAYPAMPPAWEVRGNRFAIRRGAMLPPRCVKCGATATEPWLAGNFSWHHPALYILVISPLIYLIVALIVRKQFQLAVPLCDTHREIRKKRLWIGGLSLAACIPLPVFLGIIVSNDSFTGFAVFLGFALFIVGIVFLMMAPVIRPTKIEQDNAEFSGASPEFLAALAH